MVDDVIRLPPVPLVVMPAGAPSEKEHMDTKLLKCLVFSAATTVLKKIDRQHTSNHCFRGRVVCSMILAVFLLVDVFLLLL